MRGVESRIAPRPLRRRATDGSAGRVVSRANPVLQRE